MNLKKRIKSFFALSRKANDGFTLAELIVVIAILGILAGVSVAAYNGYIEKANRAADERLLAVVNRAYAAACVDYGQDSLVTKGFATLQGNAGSKTVKQVTSYYDQTGTSFAKYFADNEDAVFKVFQHLIWKDGVFVNEDAESYRFADGDGKEYFFQRSDIEAYKNSNFADIGVYDTLTLMDNLVGMLATFNSDGNPIDSLLKKDVDENGNEVDNEFETFLKENGFMEGNEVDNTKVASGLVFYAAEKLSALDPNAVAAAMTGDATTDLRAMYCLVSGETDYTKASFSEKAVAAATMYAISASYAESDYNRDNMATPDGTDQVGSLGTMLGYLGGCYQKNGYKDYLASDEVANDVAGFVGVLRTLETNDENAINLLKTESYSFNGENERFYLLIEDGILQQ